MLTRLDTLITDVRSTTENQEVSSTIGIPDAEFIRYFNMAQDKIVAKIIAQNKTVFGQEFIFPTVIGQEDYDLPADAFIANKIISVQYSSSGAVTDYTPLVSKTLLERDTSGNGHPSIYILRNGKILLNPIPAFNSGSIRLNYLQRPPNLELRRGTVSAVTLNNVNKTITALTITSTTADVAIINNNYNYVCVVDRLGNIKMKKILLAATGVTGVGPYTVNIDSSFVFDTGETIAVGDYIVPGYFASSHHHLDDILEHYLVSWVTLKIFKRDSSAQDVSMSETEITDMERDIVNSYANIDEGFIMAPMLGNFEDWGGL